MLYDAALYASLFGNAFLAATILPAFSEIALATLVTAGKGHPVLLVFFATSGNVLGSLLNWWIGRKITVFESKKWFPFTPRQVDRAAIQFKKYGVWSLLFAWLPIIGDPLTLVAGVLRTPMLPFLILVTVGKTLRYVVIVIAIS